MEFSDRPFKYQKREKVNHLHKYYELLFPLNRPEYAIFIKLPEFYWMR